jgi:hypothetical protein
MRFLGWIRKSKDQARAPSNLASGGASQISAAKEVDFIATLQHLKEPIVDILFRQKSAIKKRHGRDHIKKWEKSYREEMAWDWERLGIAMEELVDAIRLDPLIPEPWTYLAYLYHIIGQPTLGQRCLAHSRTLAEPSMHHEEPGFFYGQVEKAIHDGTLVSGEDIVRPAMPTVFIQKYADRLSSGHDAQDNG